VSARTFGRLELWRTGGATGWLLADLEPHVVIRLKQLFPSVPKASPPPYRLPSDPMTSADLDWFTSRYPLAASAADLAELKARRAAFDSNQAEMERILSADYQPPLLTGLREGMAIRPYQAQAVEILSLSGGLLCGDEVGLGKTFTAAAACLTPGSLPAIVVCHPHLQQQWVKVIETFTTLKAHAIRSTKPYPLPPADVRVFRYSQLLGWADMFERIGVGLAVYDEVQELRTGTESGKGSAALRLSRAALRNLGLSATPIYNYGREIFAIMAYLRPDALGDYESFMREWSPRGRITDPKALGSYLREKHAFVRRTKHDVGQDMPAVNKIVDTIDYDHDALASIEEMARALAIRATEGRFTERGQAARDLDLLVRQQTGVAKAKQVAAVARILVEGGEPIVLVGWHREVYDIWQARCSTMVFGELDWSPGVHHQCIGRLDREGQAAPVTALFLVVEEGSDPPLMEVLGIKASEASQITDPSLGVQQAHSDSSALRRLVERYLDKRMTVATATDAVREVVDV